MAGDTFRRQLQPDDLLLGDRDAEHELAGRKEVAAAESSLVEDVLRLEVRVMVLAHPPGAEGATDLLVGYGHQDDVAIQPYLLTFQRDERIQVRHADAFHVHRTAAPDSSLSDLAAERLVLPPRRIGGDDVHVMEQDDG